jgi:hypothetical protein
MDFKIFNIVYKNKKIKIKIIKKLKLKIKFIIKLKKS